MFACIQTWARLARGPRMYFWCLVPNLLPLWLRGPGASPNLCQLQTRCLCQGFVITGLNNLSKSLLTSVGWLPWDKPSLMEAIFPLALQTPPPYLTTRNVKAFLLFSNSFQQNWKEPSLSWGQKKNVLYPIFFHFCWLLEQTYLLAGGYVSASPWAIFGCYPVGKEVAAGWCCCFFLFICFFPSFFFFIPIFQEYQNQASEALVLCQKYTWKYLHRLWSLKWETNSCVFSESCMEISGTVLPLSFPVTVMLCLRVVHEVQHQGLRAEWNLHHLYVL